MGDDEPCRHERSHIIDSRFHGSGYATDVTRAIFCDVCRIQRWLDVEVALATAQSELGIIPPGAVEAIAAVAHARSLDLDAVAAEIRTTTHSLVPLIRSVRRASAGTGGEFIHFGATTQDIQDTAQSLEMRDVLDAVAALLDRLLATLRPLAARYRDQTMVGRTHAMPALPITFGLKVAGWIDELLRHRERLDQARPRIVVAQLFGGAGTMAALGEQAIALMERFAAKLQIGVPLLGWHVVRDRVGEFVALMAMIAATLARVADEVRTLSRPEIGEIKLSWSAQQVGSSTMPHKRNPEDCEQVVVLARLARAQVPLALDSMVLEHERDYRGTRLEWCAIADVSHYTVSALQILSRVVETLTVVTDRMDANVRLNADALCTERLVLGLVDSVGPERAYDLVFEACRRALDRDRPIRSEMRESPEIMAHVGDEETLEAILNPSRYHGASAELVSRVLRALDAAPKTIS